MTALQALRGVEMVTAVMLVAEVGDFRRFASASELMSFVGLVPSEHSSGGSVVRAGLPGRAILTCGESWSRRPGTTTPAPDEQGDPGAERSRLGPGPGDRVEGPRYGFRVVWFA